MVPKLCPWLTLLGSPSVGVQRRDRWRWVGWHGDLQTYAQCPSGICIGQYDTKQLSAMKCELAERRQTSGSFRSMENVGYPQARSDLENTDDERIRPRCEQADNISQFRGHTR